MWNTDFSTEHSHPLNIHIKVLHCSQDYTLLKWRGTANSYKNINGVVFLLDKTNQNWTSPFFTTLFFFFFYISAILWNSVCFWSDIQGVNISWICVLAHAVNPAASPLHTIFSYLTYLLPNVAYPPSALIHYKKGECVRHWAMVFNVWTSLVWTFLTSTLHSNMMSSLKFYIFIFYFLT